MGTQDDPDPRRTPDEGPARPEQTDEGFATGADNKPDPPEEDLEPDFARGTAETDPHKHGRHPYPEHPSHGCDSRGPAHTVPDLANRDRDGEVRAEIRA